MKFISIKLLNCLPSSRIEYVLPICRAPVISKAFWLLLIKFCKYLSIFRLSIFVPFFYGFLAENFHFSNAKIPIFFHFSNFAPPFLGMFRMIRRNVSGKRFCCGKNLTQITQITQIHPASLIPRILGGIRHPITQMPPPNAPPEQSEG
jgi:hypothetical protein